MKLLRILYLVVLLVSLSLSFAFYYRHQKLSRYFDQTLEETAAKLEGLNKTIAILEEDNAGFRSRIQALKQERDQLQAKIAGLIKEKSVLENSFLSLKELKKAIKAVRLREQMQRRSAKIAMLRTEDEIALRQGNKGYLVKHSHSTFKPKIRVELEAVGKLSYKDQ